MSASVSPDQALRRVLRISRLNGWSVAWCAAVGTLLAALLGDLTGFLVGSMAVGSGILEVRGHRLLAGRKAAGWRWLVRSQWLLLGVISIYALTRLAGGSEFRWESLTPEMRAALAQFDLDSTDLEPLIRMFTRIFYVAVIGATCLYQGGLALYYSRQKALVGPLPVAPPPLPPGG